MRGFAMLPDRLKTLRVEKKRTQKDIADFLGISRQAYTKYENDQTEPDNKTLSKLAEYFDVTTDYLLGRTDIRNPEKQPENRFFFDLDDATEEDLEDLEDMFEILKRRKQKRENKHNE
jgi:transcriptional regulator with XRE-family HTH domain